MIAQTVRAWLSAGLALLLATTGMVSLIAGNSTVSTARMAVAAGVLGAYAAAVAIVFTDRALRTRLRCLLWGVTIPAAVSVVNALLVLSTSAAGRALLTALPWLIPAGVVSAFGLWLPSLRLPAWARRRRLEADPE